MQIICDKCQKKIRVPDDKIPKDKTVYLNCPSCKRRIEVNQKTIVQDNQSKSQQSRDLWTLQEITSESYDAAEKPFDFIEEEGKTAIVCVLEPKIRQIVISALEQMDYQHKVAENARDALKQMRYHTFDLVVVNEKFECRDITFNSVLTFLQHLPMSTRRNIYAVLLSRQFRTMDNMEAFHQSVNLIINLQNLEHFQKILNRGMVDNEDFYRMYKSTAKKIMGL